MGMGPDEERALYALVAVSVSGCLDLPERARLALAAHQYLWQTARDSFAPRHLFGSSPPRIVLKFWGREYEERREEQFQRDSEILDELDAEYAEAHADDGNWSLPTGFTDSD